MVVMPHVATFVMLMTPVNGQLLEARALEDMDSHVTLNFMIARSRYG